MSTLPRITTALPITSAEARRIARTILAAPYEVASAELVHDLCGRDYVPGTFYVAERKESPAFLSDDCESDYENWIRTTTRSHVEALLRARLLPSSPSADSMRALEDATLATLDAPLESGLMLCESITNQQVTDIIWRILKTLLAGDPYAPYHVCWQFNEVGYAYAMGILRRERPGDPIAALRRSIVAGALGCDIKAQYVAAGPSRLVDTGIIPLFTGQKKRTLESAQSEIDRRTAKGFAIDCVGDFEREVLGRSGPVSLLFFTDDYIEAVFDLWAMQTWLDHKHDLSVTIVPKWGQHANDASFDDILALLNESLLGGLRALGGTRLWVAPHGPAGSGINAYELSPQILEALDAADVVLFKGARSYEMLQGIRKKTYFAFNVIHSFTESLTGLDASTCPAVFIRQEPGVPSFYDFRARGHRKHVLSSGRVIGLAGMTALEYSERITSRQYA